MPDGIHRHGPLDILRTWLIWTAGFVAFPLGGVAGTAVAGRVDSPASAALGGAVTGLVIGAGQALASSRRLDFRWWIPATAIGMCLGLLLGAAVTGYRTSLGNLALMGALTGLVLGVTQAIALPRHTQLRWVWAAAMPMLWALGWTVTTLIMVSVDEQFTVFGFRRGSHVLRFVRTPAAPAPPQQARASAKPVLKQKAS